MTGAKVGGRRRAARVLEALTEGTYLPLGIVVSLVLGVGAGVWWVAARFSQCAADHASDAGRLDRIESGDRDEHGALMTTKDFDVWLALAREKHPELPDRLR